MSSAAITYPDGRTVVAHGPAATVAPHTLGACLAHTPDQLPAGVTSTGAPAPRSVVDACAWRYLIDADGAVRVGAPAAHPGRWHQTSRIAPKEHTR